MKRVSHKKIKSDLAFVFPGQGSQQIGMLAELASEYPAMIDTFNRASTVLGYDLWDLAQNGPEARLKETEVTQPLMLASGVAVWRAWQERCDLLPALMAGHSLGEYTALVCSNAIDFDEAVALVEKRGQSMQAAVPLGKGSMMAILGLPNDVIDGLCRQVAYGKVSGANYNAPGQVVIGGYKEAVDSVAERALKEGATKIIPVAMSAPSHCPLMQPAADELQPYIESLKISEPDVPIVANVSATLVKKPQEIRKALLRQICKPVLWSSVVKCIVNQGVELCFECGPGKVLSAIGRRIHRPLKSKPIGSLDNFREAVTLLTYQNASTSDPSVS